MTFLVLIQGYAVLREPLVSLTEGAVVAVVVGVGTGIGAYALEHRVATWAARRALAKERRGADGDEREKT